METDRPSVTRILATVLVVALLFVLVGVGSMWFVLAEEGIAPPPSAVMDDVGRTVQTGGALADKVQRQAEADLLSLELVEADGTPAPGVTLRLDDGRQGLQRSGVSDADGRLTFRDLPGSVWWEVTADPPWFVVDPSTLRPTLEAHVQTLLLRRTCAGDVRFVHGHGGPFKGKVRDPVDGWIELVDGRATVPHRFCGRGKLRVSEPKAMPYRIVSVVPLEVEGDELVEVVMPDVGEAEVRTVDEAGAPIDVRLFPGKHLGTGRYGLRGREETRRIQVQRDGGHLVGHEIPLDGGVHELVVPADREVALTLLCESCPQRVTCLPPGTYAAESTCEGEPPELQCRCPGGPGVVHGRSAPAMIDTQYDLQPLGRVPADASEWEIDATGDRGAIEGTWTGSAPCMVDVTRSGERVVGDHRCEEGGELLVSDLFPGSYELRISGTTRDTATRTVQVGSGQTVDLGAVDPAEAPAEDPLGEDTGL